MGKKPLLPLVKKTGDPAPGPTANVPFQPDADGVPVEAEASVDLAPTGEATASAAPSVPELSAEVPLDATVSPSTPEMAADLEPATVTVAGAVDALAPGAEVGVQVEARIDHMATMEDTTATVAPTTDAMSADLAAFAVNATPSAEVSLPLAEVNATVSPAVPEMAPELSAIPVNASPTIDAMSADASITVSAAPAVPSASVDLVALNASATPSAEVKMGADPGPSVQATADASSFAADAAVNATAAPTVPEMSADANVNVTVAPTVPTMATASEQVVNATPTTEVAMGADPGPTVNLDVSELRLVTSQILASKDSWVPTAKVAGNCVDTANKDTQDLKVSNVAADNDARAIFAFSLGGFPTNATVLEAKLYLKPTATSAASQTMRISEIATGDEGWSESTVACANIPADSGATQNFTQGTAADEVEVTLSSSFHSKIQARMGVGTFTLKLNEATGVPTGRTYESKDQGTNNASGPRLVVTFTVPV